MEKCYPIFHDFGPNNGLAVHRLKALGQGENTAFGVPRDLHGDPLKYNEKHYSHSREFRSNIVAERAFYQYVLLDGGL